MFHGVSVLWAAEPLQPPFGLSWGDSPTRLVDWAMRTKLDQTVKAPADQPRLKVLLVSPARGTLPGGRTLNGNVIRTRIPDEDNFPAHGGNGTISTNPAEMQTWKLQSHITYTISGREYVKSRTIVRTQ